MKLPETLSVCHSKLSKQVCAWIPEENHSWQTDFMLVFAVWRFQDLNNNNDKIIIIDIVFHIFENVAAHQVTLPKIGKKKEFLEKIGENEKDAGQKSYPTPRSPRVAKKWEIIGKIGGWCLAKEYPPKTTPIRLSHTIDHNH